MFRFFLKKHIVSLGFKNDTVPLEMECITKYALRILAKISTRALNNKLLVAVKWLYFISSREESYFLLSENCFSFAVVYIWYSRSSLL